MSIIQFLGILFALLMIYFTYFYYKRGIFNYYDLLIWAYIWLVLLFVVSFPSKLALVIRPLKIIRVMDLLTIGAAFLLFALVFVVFVRLRYSERRIQKIVKEIALKEKEE